MRNYKVSTTKAETVLGFRPVHSVEDIVASLHEHQGDMGNLNQDNYYNIRIFKEIAKREELRNKRLSEIDDFKY